MGELNDERVEDLDCAAGGIRDVELPLGADMGSNLG